MIIVDGCKSDKEISNFANLEEVLTNLMDDEKMDDRVVTDVFVNNESFSEIYPHQAEDVSCDTITSVEVRSVPAAELAVDMSAEMGKVARMMGSGARNVARLFREASDTDALELFQEKRSAHESGTMPVRRGFGSCPPGNAGAGGRSL